MKLPPPDWDDEPSLENKDLYDKFIYETFDYFEICHIGSLFRICINKLKELDSSVSDEDRIKKINYSEKVRKSIKTQNVREND